MEQSVRRTFVLSAIRRMGSSSSIYDVSAAGLSVTLGGVTVGDDDWMDDENPIRVERQKTCEVEWSCNGKMIRNATPQSLTISVAVVANSITATNFKLLMNKQVAQQMNASANNWLNGMIVFKNGGSILLGQGTMTDGIPISSVRPDGKRQGIEFVFTFGKWE